MQRPPAAPKTELRFGWLVLAALAAQLVVIYAGFGEAEELRRFVFPASYVPLIAFVVLNRRRVGLLVIGVGLALNFLAVVANGGLMPISPDSMEKAGLGDELAELELGDAVPFTKNVLLAESETHLRWLTDRIAWRALGPFPVFSIGDVVVAAGLVVTVLELLFPFALQRSSRGRTSVT